MFANKTLGITLIWLLHAFSVNAVPWIATGYIQESFETDGSSTLWTKTNVIAPASPIPSALAAFTDVDLYENHLTVVEILLPPNAQTTNLQSSSSSIFTDYYVPITFTPPARCNTTWEHVRTVDINVPRQVQSQLTPWSVSTSIGTASYWEGTVSTTITTEVHAILFPSDVADDVYASLSLEEVLYLVTSCSWRDFSPTSAISYPPGPSRTVTATATGALPTNGVSSFGITCGKDNPYCINCVRKKQYCEENCPSYRGITKHPVTGEYVHCEDADYWIWGSTRWHLNARAYIIGFTVAPSSLVFLVGMLFSGTNFVKLMQGHQARLGIPTPWVVLTLGLGLIFLGPKWEAKFGSEQADLGRDWKEMETRKKVGLYFRYAFRWTYPPILGREPHVVNAGPLCRRFVKKGYTQAT